MSTGIGSCLEVSEGATFSAIICLQMKVQLTSTARTTTFFTTSGKNSDMSRPVRRATRR